MAMKQTFLLFFISVSALLTKAQPVNKFELFLLQLDSSLEKTGTAYPQEHIFFITDKKEYIAGETIWVNAFISLENQPTILSKTAYAELSDCTGKIINKKMLPIVNGAAHADFLLPGNTPSGAYVINVYTQWAKNFPSGIAQQQIFIIGTDYTKAPFQWKLYSDTVKNILLLPEGGSIAAGVETNFALQLTSKNNLPVADTFFLTEDGKTITSGKTGTEGLATVTFTPLPAKKYKLHSTGFTDDINSVIFRTVTFKIRSTNKSKVFLSLDKNQTSGTNKYLVVGISNDKICYQSVFDFAEGTTATAINRSKLPEGIIEFYVFDENEIIQAYRKVNNPAPVVENFINTKNDQPGKTTVSLTSVLKTGVISVKIPGEYISINRSPVTNRITQINQLQKKYNIEVTDLQSDKSQSVIDQLLCLQTSPILGKKWSFTVPQLKYTVESGISVRGKVSPYAGTRSETGYDAELWVYGEDSSQALAGPRTTPAGEFAVNDFSFKKEAKIYFQGSNPKNKKELLKVEIYPSYFDTLKTASLLPMIRYEKEVIKKSSDPRIQKLLDSLQKTDPQFRNLDAVIVKAKKASPLDSLKKEYLSPIFDDGGATVLVPDGTNYMGIWHFIRNNMPGIQIDGDINNPQKVSFSRYNTVAPVNNTGEDLSESFGEADGVLFFLNEVQVSKDIISSLNIDDIALISVNKQPAAALGAYNGYISFFTKKGASNTRGNSKSLSFIKMAGYSITRDNLLLVDNITEPGKTIYLKQINSKDDKSVSLSLPLSKNGYIITITGWDEKGKFILEEKIINQ
jgi:hypothetical protein